MMMTMKLQMKKQMEMMKMTEIMKMMKTSSAGVHYMRFIVLLLLLYPFHTKVPLTAALAGRYSENGTDLRMRYF